MIEKVVHSQFENRKSDHIRWALDARTQTHSFSDWDSVQVPVCSFPETRLQEIQLSYQDPVWGHQKTPFAIVGMTAGHPDAHQMNQRLVRQCRERGWGFGFGSLRRSIEDETYREVRIDNPSPVLLGNIGLTELIRLDSKNQFSKLEQALEYLQCNGLAVHLNAIQEAIQPEGNTNFSEGLRALDHWLSFTKLKTGIKETGSGFSGYSLKKLRKTLSENKLAFIDVSGLGGTHWGRVEALRAEQNGNSLKKNIGDTFQNWGISTVQCLRDLKNENVECPVWASGGIRSGLDAFKAISLGASKVGFAKPALAAALESEETLVNWMIQIEEEFKLAVFLSGAVWTEEGRLKWEV